MVPHFQHLGSASVLVVLATICNSKLGTAQPQLVFKFLYKLHAKISLMIPTTHACTKHSIQTDQFILRKLLMYFNQKCHGYFPYKLLQTIVKSR
jgi:hypothetical protein